jgi:hypothetical protein
MPAFLLYPDQAADCATAVRYTGMGHMDTNVPEKNVEDNVRDHRLLLADRHVEL